MTEKKHLKRRVRARQAKTGEAYTTARMHVLAEREADPARPQTAPERIVGIVLKCNEQSMRVYVPEAGTALTLRCSSAEASSTAPAQFIDATLRRRWHWNDAEYAGGRIERAWTDVPSLGLTPLPLDECGVEDLNRGHDAFEPPDPYAELWRFAASAPRRSHEFDPIALGAGLGPDPDDEDTCPIAEAAEVSSYDPQEARDMLMDVLLKDLRCIDAHAHLGNFAFASDPEQALVHYEIGVAIGDLSLGRGFSDLLPWGLTYNRAFLRALRGYALCLWRLERMEEARSAFERLLALNPCDNQGARFCWYDVKLGQPWRDDDTDSEPAGPPAYRRA